MWVAQPLAVSLGQRCYPPQLSPHTSCITSNPTTLCHLRNISKLAVLFIIWYQFLPRTMIWLAVMPVVASSVNHTPAEAWELGNTLLIQLQHSQDCSDWFQMTCRCKGKLFIEIAVKIKLTNILHTKNNSRNSVWMIDVCIVVIFQFYRQNIVQIGARGSFKKCKNWQKNQNFKILNNSQNVGQVMSPH